MRALARLSAGRLAAATALCAALFLLAGCGESSSGGSSTGSSSASGATSTGSGPGGSGATGGSAREKAIKSGGVKVATTPKFAAPSQSTPVQSGVVKVQYRNIAIDPDTVRVKAGTTVKWTNYDEGIEHNVTSEGGPDHFASGNFAAGSSVEFKLTKPGIVHYECTNHPTTMNGTIEVVK